MRRNIAGLSEPFLSGYSTSRFFRYGDVGGDGKVERVLCEGDGMFTSRHLMAGVDEGDDDCCKLERMLP